jgi:hypothetical protein
MLSRLYKNNSILHTAAQSCCPIRSTTRRCRSQSPWVFARTGGSAAIRVSNLRGRIPRGIRPKSAAHMCSRIYHPSHTPIHMDNEVLLYSYNHGLRSGGEYWEESYTRLHNS